MKTLLIALGALALTSTATLARDVNSTAPDNDELSQVTVQSEQAGDHTFNPAALRNVLSGNGSHDASQHNGADYGN